MALVVSKVEYSKNPVNVAEVFTLKVEVIETPDVVVLYCGSFICGQQILL
jgi:hypothetical protein